MWLIVPGKGLLAALSAIYTMIHRYTPPTIRYVYPQHRGRGNTQHVIVEKANHREAPLFSWPGINPNRIVEKIEERFKDHMDHWLAVNLPRTIGPR